METNILIVDDEAAIADLVEVYLKNEGYTVHKFGRAGDALACVASTPLDLAILDVMLPDMDGFTLCQKIREAHLFPILMLTARVEDMDKIMGLTLGADDYLTKPFNPLELVARVKTQLRRYTRYNQGGQPGGEVQEHDFRGLQISRATHKCVLFGEELPLTPGIFHPMAPVPAPGAGGVQRGAVRVGVGREVYGQQQHRHVPHRPPAGEDARTQPKAEIHQDCVGGGLHH